MARHPRELDGDPGSPAVPGRGPLGQEHPVALRPPRPPHEVHHALGGPLFEEALGRGLLRGRFELICRFRFIGVGGLGHETKRTEKQGRNRVSSSRLGPGGDSSCREGPGGYKQQLTFRTQAICRQEQRVDRGFSTERVIRRITVRHSYFRLPNIPLATTVYQMIDCFDPVTSMYICCWNVVTSAPHRRLQSP